MHHDLIIVGGGMVGASLALALRSSGLQIALVEATLPRFEDPRLFGLTENSCQFLRNLEIWQKLAEHATPIHRVHVSYKNHFGIVRLNREDVCLPQLGYVISAYYIAMVLHEALKQQSNITYYCPATLMMLQQTDVVTLTLKTNEGDKILQSPIVIAADGMTSIVREQLNIKTQVIDYQQSAIVTQTLLQRSHYHVAYERFNANGAIAMLPLINHRCATIWTADHATIAQLMTLPDESFVASLQREFGYRLGRLLNVSQRHVFPIKMVQAQESIKQCVLLLGNAAHTLHPIAAQGFNLALYEVAALTKAIMDKIAHCQLFTSIDLQHVIQDTQKQRSFSVNTSHQLARLFKQRSLVLNMFLSLGMVGLDILKPIKGMFINKISMPYSQLR
ncbi:MAG TPA: FAD-dependent monooxygenase [Gammaproteobacteria bacterium]|nr:FAD-dependent monooxygenase [Gammaproteobacteria bacterium]